MTADLQTLDDRATWHRLSPRMLLVHPVIELIRALPALIGAFFAGSTNGQGGRWGLITAGIVVVLSLSRWFTTRLRLTNEQVQLRHGLLRRRTIATRRDRIRTVDVTSHLLHRVLGLSRVVVGTGTSDRSGQGRIVLDGLTVAAAATLRDDLLHHRGAQSVAGDAARSVGAGASVDTAIVDSAIVDSAIVESASVDATSVETTSIDTEHLSDIARLDPRWIRYAPFTLSGVITGFVIYGFLWRVQSESGVNLLRTGPLRSVRQSLDRMPGATVALTVLLAAALFVTVTSTVGYVLAFWNFRLRRHDGGTLQVTRGLVTTRATSIERRRLVGVEISEALLLRAVGGARVLAVATGLRIGRGAERGGEVLLPPAPRAVADDVATRVLDGSAAVTAALHRHGPAARRRRIARALVVGVVVVGATLLGWATGGSGWVVVVGAVPLVAAVPLGLDRYASLGHTVVDGSLVSRFGSLVRRRTVLACPAVIGWNLRSTWFQRRLGLVTATATTAAGRQHCRVSDLASDQALALTEAVTPGLLGQFRRPARTQSTTTGDTA